jgi:hypothetical protein
MKLIDKLFLIKEIKSKEGVIHFKRWQLLKTPWFSIYIHGIYKADEDAHLHDHPWDYYSMSIYGRFIEKNKGAIKCNYLYVSTFKLISRKAEQFHTIHKLLTKSVYTFFIAKNRRRDWGYDVNGEWIDHKTYRKLKNSGQL